MPAGKKKETKPVKKVIKNGVVPTEISIMTRLEVVEKMLVITRDELKEVEGIVKRMKDRMGL